MARFDNRHSRIVAWAKVVLPLLALCILSTLFLVSRPVGRDSSLPYGEAELDDILQEDRLRDPAFAGVTEDGSALAIGAAEARPDPEDPGRALVREIAARVETPEGGVLDIAAGEGTIDQTARQARLAAGVTLRSSTGYVVDTEAVTAHFDETRVESDGAVTAEGPPGRIEAGRMILRRDDEGRYLLDFTEGVRLLYSPPTGNGENP